MTSIIKAVFFALLKFSITGEVLPDTIKNDFDANMLKPLFVLSKRHDVTHLIADALDKNNLFFNEDDTRNLFLRERDIAIYRYEQINYEYQEVCKVLEEEKISFLPLKGSIMRSYYPEPWMRTSCDVDILIQERDLTRISDVLSNQLNFTAGEIGKNDANFYAPSGVHFEFRYRLSGLTEQAQEVVSRIWLFAKPRGGVQLFLTDEMFYFYHIEHMAEHFSSSGCGIRFFLDVWILNNNLKIDRNILEGYLKDAGMNRFEKAVQDAVGYWFDNKEKTAIVDEIESYVLNAGLYGIMENRVVNQQRRNGGKARYLISRVFLSYDELKYKYPLLKTYPILYPFYQIKRWLKFFKKDTKTRALHELEETRNGDKNKQERVVNLLKNLGL